ncbi:MAG: NADH-ubiquinone oxidoreductase-F iron-sulfur binding region domain-containing protein [Myxococcota bacterium]
MALVGGPMGRVLPAARFDTPLDYDGLPGLGHAGVVVLDDTVSARDLARHLIAFAAAESGGTCTPCRVGAALLDRTADAPALGRVLDTLEIGSLCGFGLGVPRPLRDRDTHERAHRARARPALRLPGVQGDGRADPEGVTLPRHRPQPCD